jgi:hypothetical protein
MTNNTDNRVIFKVTRTIHEDVLEDLDGELNIAKALVEDLEDVAVSDDDCLEVGSRLEDIANLAREAPHRLETLAMDLGAHHGLKAGA